MMVEKPKQMNSNYKSYVNKHSTTPKNTFQNYKSTNTKEVNLECKLCGSHSHNMSHCHEFKTYDSKVARLNHLSMSIRCAGSGHEEHQCCGKQGKLKYPCKLYGTREHFTALCPQDGQVTNVKTKVSLCLAQINIDSCQMLPTRTLTLKCGSRTRKARCLIDSGSQRSYLSESFAKLIRPDISNIY